MISNIGLATVVCLMIWIVFNHARRSELILLLPFVVASNFFGFLSQDTFAREGIIQQGDVVLILVFILGVIFSSDETLPSVDDVFHNSYSRIAILFTLFLLAVLVLSSIEYGNFWESFKVFRRFFRYISVFVFFYMMRRLRGDQLKRLLMFIENLTILLAILYIINFGLGLPVFAIASYKEYSFRGETLLRNYLALPSFAVFTLSMLLLKPHFTLKSVIGVVAIILAFLLTYTRDYVVSTFLVVVAATVISLIYYRAPFKRIALLGIVFVGVGMVSLNIFSNQFQFLLSRVKEVHESGGVEQTKNFLIRQNIVLSRAELALQTNPLCGVGFLSEEYSTKFHFDIYTRPWDRPGQLIVGDQSWGNFIASIGFGGSAIFLLLFFYPIYFIIKTRSFRFQSTAVYACLISLFVEIFITAFFFPSLITDVFQICFYFGLIDYYISYSGLMPTD